MWWKGKIRPKDLHALSAGTGTGDYVTCKPAQMPQSVVFFDYLFYLTICCQGWGKGEVSVILLNGHLSYEHQVCG